MLFEAVKVVYTRITISLTFAQNEAFVFECKWRLTVTNKGHLKGTVSKITNRRKQNKK